MDMDLKLELQQKLLMTPELRQAIAILQISSQELNELVNKELTDNPLLEAKEDAGLPDNNLEKLLSIQRGFNEINDISEEQEVSFLEYASQPLTLEAHLRLQLEMHKLDNMDMVIGVYLIGCLDENGYLEVSVEEVAKVFGVDVKRVDNVLRLIHSFDPSGVGARNLQECLTLQAVHKGYDTPQVLAIINEYLEDVAQGRIRKIAERLEISPDKVQEAIDIIKRLNPKPGVNFNAERNAYIYPDVEVREVSGQLVVVLNNSLPTIYINPEYKKLLNTGDNQTKDYIARHLNAAVWLIKSIDQRQKTLFNLMTKITELQPDFFRKGIKYLKPMNLKDIARQLGVHESTISRAAANKYVNTPFGIFSIKSLFTSGINTAEGEVSRENIKRHIKEIIKHEDVFHPLTDQQLVECLRNEKIFISRRTVAKYREEMNIPSAKLRRRY